MLTILTMRIDAVAEKPDRAGRYRVTLSDGSIMRLYRQTVEDHALYAGRELTDEELTSLRESAGQMSAKMRAVRIVTASNVSKADLRRRLVDKGETPEQADKAVQWLQDLQLLDDETTARQIVESCVAKGYGVARAKQALYEKRIPKHLWDGVLSDYPDQTERIYLFLKSRLGEQWDARDLKRATDALLRKGHNYGAIREALRLLQIDSDELREEY